MAEKGRQAPGRISEDVERIMFLIERELHSLRVEKDKISKRIGLIKTTISGLVAVFGPGIIGQDLQSLLRTPAQRHNGATRD